MTNALAYFGEVSVNNNNLMIPTTVSQILEYLGQNALAYFGVVSVFNKTVVSPYGSHYTVLQIF